MKNRPDVVKRAINKALTSQCKYCVSALGFNRRGELIYSASNRPRFSREGGSVHAEMGVMLKAGPGLRTIVLCRANRAGDLLPISPCHTCAKKAEELGIKIITLQGE